jgi:hypothetical protein
MLIRGSVSNRTMTFLDQPVIDTREAVAKGNGDQVVFTDRYRSIFAEVLDAKVVGYFVEDDHERVEGIHFTETFPSSRIHAQRPTRCWECFSFRGHPPVLPGPLLIL